MGNSLSLWFHVPALSLEAKLRAPTVFKQLIACLKMGGLQAGVDQNDPTFRNKSHTIRIRKE